jgi:glycosyltransferase involved in cell wall biosynthesis
MGFKKEISKLRAQCVSLAADIPLPAFLHESSPKLVMTLLVRNEADIVRRNIDFHLKSGVDHIVATDNGSTDETPDILAEYAKSGLLTLIHEPKQDYAQSTWVNRMADLAFARLGPCFVFHCDADEFWFSKSGNLKNELSGLPLVECLSIPVHNVLLLFDHFQEKFPENAVLHVNNPVSTTDILEDSKTKSLYLFPYPDKVFYRARKHMPHVDMGNHVLVDRKVYVTRESRDISVYHFPVRSYTQFQRKVIEGGSAIVSNPKLAPGFGWHWRRWYQSYLDGKLRDEYRLLVLDEKKAAEYAKNGVLTVDYDIPRNIISFDNKAMNCP